MRGLVFFVVGTVAGLALHMAIAQSNRGIVGLNHVGVSVTDLDEAYAYYTQTMGFPEAFRVLDENEQPALIYVQVSPNTFIELQPSSAQRPPGISHFGLEVEDIATASEMFKRRGARVAEQRGSRPGVVLVDIDDPNGIRIELLQFPSPFPRGVYRR